MRFSCLSLFPDMIRASVEASILGRALEKGLFELEFLQIRDFAVNAYGKVDDSLYGGGTGMLMMAEPIFQAVQRAKELYRQKRGEPRHERLIYLSPRGQLLKQKIAEEYLESDHIMLLCGHYEGVDQRVLDELGAEELSIGDYVLTGGELPAAILIDACARMIPGVLPDASAWQEESHASGLLEADQFTRPAIWKGREVPPVYQSGHAEHIRRAKRRSALQNTLRQRPDLLCGLELSREDWELLAEAEP